ncbi:hypothetical protein AGDE_16524 [Angomonas deanei]|uniref:Uncharacterized protein n=1 Tax=Angomonas deanei TaxID=59799 RepID=A0A7G2C6P3_9TRYP|nr:hypothetical protein AGDE_16524 [Angomonas deanei]CAD2214731.1 hypothetical protein, conserved [Angomonas deanei]|eukprot:EPY16939.1 hypothetical protein AGDE_16524 [Angomonas deanei]
MGAGDTLDHEETRRKEVGELFERVSTFSDWLLEMYGRLQTMEMDRFRQEAEIRSIRLAVTPGEWCCGVAPTH